MQYRVWCPDNDESFGDGTRIEAMDPEEAAERWAEHEDSSSAEYSIVAQNSRPIVYVQAADGTGSVTHWRVSGETVPAYYACEVCSACSVLRGEHTFGETCALSGGQ